MPVESEKGELKLREHLYRGIWVHGDKEWILGELISIYDRHSSPQRTFYIVDYHYTDFDDNVQMVVDEYAEVITETIGEYTGKTDKNGKKIFEGDIVVGSFPYADKGLVIWDKKRCGFYIQPCSYSGKAGTDKYYKMNSNKLEIIGNVFDNPELLETPQQ